MKLRKIVYWIAVTAGAMSLFLPLLASQFLVLRRLMGSYSPLKAALVLAVSIAVAALISDESSSELP